MPNNVKVTYAIFICDICPLKPEKHRVRLTAGGDKLDYEEDARSLVVSLLDTKILLNSVITDADKGSRYFTSDIKNFYLNNLMRTYRYMKIPIHLFTDEILEEYQIKKLYTKVMSTSKFGKVSTA